MKAAITILAAIVLCSAGELRAEYSFKNTGTWPASWPPELEELRKGSRTLEGPFTKRDAFEAAWPHLLKVKSPGAPIVLRRGRSFWLGDKSSAGVCIHTPPEGEAPVDDSSQINGHWERTIYLELIVDGDIIDLNRIPLPPNTPILDERFKPAK